MVREALTNEDGYTVIEILIALTLISIVLAITGSVFVFISGQMIQWQSNIDTQNELHIVSERLFKDALVSDQLEVTDSTISFQSYQEERYRYVVGSEIAVRNGTTLSTSLDSLKLEIPAQSDSLYQFLMKLVGDEIEHTQHITVANRTPPLWIPLEKE